MWNSVPNKSGIGWAIFWCALKCFSPPVGLTVKTPLCHKQLAHKRYGLLWTARPVFLFWKICSAEHTTPAHQLNLNGLPHAVQTGDNPELSEKIPVGRGQRPSNKTWFVQNLTCQPFPSMRCSDISDMITPAGAMFVHPIHGQLVGPPSEFWSFDPNFVPLG